jgi:hypothetical protein
MHKMQKVSTLVITSSAQLAEAAESSFSIIAYTTARNLNFFSFGNDSKNV